MITAHDLELRAGARLLMADVSFRVAPGDKIGLVGRNGAGKTTLTKVLAGEGLPASGRVVRGGDVGYLPQDPRTSDPDVLALPVERQVPTRFDPEFSVLDMLGTLSFPSRWLADEGRWAGWI